MPRFKDAEIPTGGGGGGAGFIRHIRLLDKGESLTMRFLTEFDDFFWERFHRVMEGGQFKGMKICVSSALGQACPQCEGGDRAGVQFLAWTYELTHDYSSVPRNAQRMKLSKAQVGTRTIYREEVNEPRLMRYSTMHFDVIRDRFDEFETLLNHTFKWRRLSEAGDRQPSYLLEPAGEGGMSSELAQVIAGLPDLEDVAMGRVESLDGQQAALQAEVKLVQRPDGAPQLGEDDPFADDPITGFTAEDGDDDEDEI